MNRHFQPPYVPPAGARPETVTRCKRSCCFTPYGCGRKRACDCHTQERPE